MADDPVGGEQLKGASFELVQANAKPRHLGIAGIARHIDDRLVAATIVQATGDQVMHALLAHVAERHRRIRGFNQSRCQRARRSCPES